MPVHYARRLMGATRTESANRHLGIALAFNAGATNAGGFLAVHQYTSHMTGIVSSIADNLVLGATDLVLAGAAGVLSFTAGAACSAIMVNFARRRRMQSKYALPLLLEAVLLIAFGLLGARLATVPVLFVPLTVMLLCFIMGLQNAVITKLSKAETRTTHVTGILTDIGIELGKFAYVNVSASRTPRVLADRERLKILASLLLAFFLGGVIGAAGFSQVGFVSTVPLALVLVFFATVPALDDLARLMRRG